MLTPIFCSSCDNFFAASVATDPIEEREIPDTATPSCDVNPSIVEKIVPSDLSAGTAEIAAVA